MNHALSQPWTSTPLTGYVSLCCDCMMFIMAWRFLCQAAASVFEKRQMLCPSLYRHTYAPFLDDQGHRKFQALQVMRLHGS
jgi:hypothetical protein